LGKNSEHWRVVSYINENEIRLFFENFCNWELIATNTDIEGGGIDILFSYFNLFENKRENILIESKHIQDDYLRPLDLADQVHKLEDQVVNFRDSKNIIKYVFEDNRELKGPVSRGLIVHRFENYSKSKYENSLNQFSIRSRKRYNPPTIFLLNNKQIKRLSTLYLHNSKKSFYWFYPTFRRNYYPGFFPYPIPEFLFSEFGFLLLKDDFSEEQILTQNIQNEKIIFFMYEEPLIKVCHYIKSIFNLIPLNWKDINTVYFLDGDPNELDKYKNNLKQADLSIKNQKIKIMEISDKKIENFGVIFGNE